MYIYMYICMHIGCTYHVNTYLGYTSIYIPHEKLLYVYIYTFECTCMYFRCTCHVNTFLGYTYRYFWGSDTYGYRTKSFLESSGCRPWKPAVINPGALKWVKIRKPFSSELMVQIKQQSVYGVEAMHATSCLGGVYVCISNNTYTHIYIYFYIHVHTTNVRKYIYIHIYIYSQVCRSLCANTHPTYMHICTYVWILHKSTYCIHAKINSVL